MYRNSGPVLMFVSIRSSWFDIPSLAQDARASVIAPTTAQSCIPQRRRHFVSQAAHFERRIFVEELRDAFLRDYAKLRFHRRPDGPDAVLEVSAYMAT
jgi:hypothetical protein